MFLVVTLPVLIGMLIRKFATNFVISKSQLIERISVLLFVIVFAAIWVEEWENIMSYIKQAGLITLDLNIVLSFLFIKNMIFDKQNNFDQKNCFDQKIEL